jgi:hypothetical protein
MHYRANIAQMRINAHQPRTNVLYNARKAPGSSLGARAAALAYTDEHLNFP